MNDNKLSNIQRIAKIIEHLEHLDENSLKACKRCITSEVAKRMQGIKPKQY